MSPTVSIASPVLKAESSFLGVKATGVKWTFPEIRGQLSKESGNDKVTVPTIKSGDEYITDSWEIALYVCPSLSTVQVVTVSSNGQLAISRLFIAPQAVLTFVVKTVRQCELGRPV